MKYYFRIAVAACIVAFFGSILPSDELSAQGWRGGGDWRNRGEGGGDWRNRGGDGGGDWRNRGGGDWRRDRGGDGDRRRDGDRRMDGQSASTSGSSSSTTSGSSMNAEDYAKGLIKMFDKNGDKMLQKEEQGELSSKNRAADQDGDGVITIDELVRASSATTPPAASPPGGTNERKGNGNGGSSETNSSGKREFTWLGATGKEGEKRKSFRFSTAADRLPPSLPGFFSRDKNGDGQVSMSEYSRSWSKKTVEEFRKYDLNDDGVITAKEATKSAASGG